MANMAAVYLTATCGSAGIRMFCENEINDITTNFLAKRIDIEEATQIVSQSPRYYLVITTAKAVCDIIVTSAIARHLYELLQKLWNILKPLFELSVKEFIDRINKSVNYIETSIKELCKKYSSFHIISEKVSSKDALAKLLQGLYYIYKVIDCRRTGLRETIRFELTKYYLEIRGLVRALCEKFNINFLKYVPKNNEDSNNNARHKDDSLTYVYSIPLEQLLYGTERQLQITREIREINQNPREERQVHTIRIEPGCHEEHVIRLEDVGDRDPINIPADLLITIRSRPHPLYQRQGADLIYTKTISYVDACSNRPIQIPLLEGQTTTINPGGMIDHNTELVIAGHGLPDPDNNGVRGRLLVRFRIQSPTNQLHCNVMTTTQQIEENPVVQFD